MATRGGNSRIRIRIASPGGTGTVAQAPPPTGMIHSTQFSTVYS